VARTQPMADALRKPAQDLDDFASHASPPVADMRPRPAEAPPTVERRLSLLGRLRPASLPP
jgi:hypothetical protein